MIPSPLLFRSLVGAAISVALGHTAVAATVTVYANNPVTGDAFTNPGTPDSGLAVGTSGWYYNNVRNGGTIGIDGTHARDGNGSVHLSGPNPLGPAPGQNSSKADIEYYSSTLGGFLGFSGMSYDWYRDSSSTAASHLHPSLRILLDRDGNLATTTDRVNLIYERAYNPGVSPVPTDVWNHDIITGSTILWNSGAGITGPSEEYHTLAQWLGDARLSSAAIIGFSSGFGSGWNSFSGAVDNISWTIGGTTTTTNFEVSPAASVPEPGSLALVAVALLGAGFAGRARRKR